MFPFLAVLVYLIAIGIPSGLLYRFGTRAWYWHAIALVAGIGIGFIPIPAALHGPACDLAFGSVFIILLIWGAGGLIFYPSTSHDGRRHANRA
jgi:hypothetical protein